MAKGIIYVESRPSSPDREQEYNTWYNEVHLPELAGARRIRRRPAGCGRLTATARMSPSTSSRATTYRPSWTT